MARKVLASVRAQWMGALALFLVIAGGTAYAANTVGSDDVIDNSLLSADLKNNQAVKSAEIANGQLNDEDIAQGTFVNFDANIGVVNAHQCFSSAITGVNATGDHLVLTPNGLDAVNELVYKVSYEPTGAGGDGRAFLQVCNPTNGALNDGHTRFNLLVIDAQ